MEWIIRQIVEELTERINASEGKILTAIQKAKEDIMANIDQEIQAATTAAEANFAATKAALSNIQTGVTALDGKITALAAQVAADAANGGTLSQASTDALAGIVSDSAALASQAQGVNTTDPSATTSAPGTPVTPGT